ncbi:very short patch repair endonuclease [Methyloversatilis discipulorum]|uniref:very short patch repair endonuclease n=1 Tax=Methyloversatilis discipulorum TaxID=1119528 RepID=UPI00036DE0F2|nr:very short patch repair endonuclease [Methyloversatilis discipulorum]
MSPDQRGSDPKSTGRKRRNPKTGPLTRSENMSRIRGRDTKPELIVRRALWASGLRYRLYDGRLPGRPDLVFAGPRMVVFVHGCFWHCHEGCINFRIPKTRSEWWAAKLARNKLRDAKVRADLEAGGWQVIVIWECEVENQAVLASIAKALKSFPKLLRHRVRESAIG